MKRTLALLLMVLSLGALRAQTVTSSRLPIVLIVTDNDPATGMPCAIPDEPKVGATMKVLYVDDTTLNLLSNQDSEACLNYHGRIGIETRGSTSQDHSKKPYGLETRMADDSTSNNVSLMGLPAENDWVLTPMNDDKSYLRDCLSYALGRRMGRYAPRTKYCEVFVNGDYRGLYFLTEKIKIDDNRVDLAKMEAADTLWPRLSGGYIVKADKTTGGDPVAWTTAAHDYSEAVNYIFHNPKPDRIAPAQAAYIHRCFDSLYAAAADANWSPADGYPSLIDVPSFVDYMIMGELASNVDIYQKSTFFYKERQGKLCAGPLWDFNLAYGNDLGTSGNGRSGYAVWQFDNGDNTGSEFWYQLFHEEHFQCLFVRRWHQLTDDGGPLCYDSVCSLIDSLQAVVGDYVSRDKQRWGYWFSQPMNIYMMKAWLQSRYSWIGSQLGGCDACSSPELPPLVISKIHYHPAGRGGFGEKQLEFVGISNAGEEAVDLTGLYLREPGLAYLFPAGTALEAGRELFLASDTAAFRAVFGEAAFGQYARHLSNRSQRLVLADAWGNAIDDVTYADQAPWPPQADGSGHYLLLDDLLADNSLAASWSVATAIHYSDTTHLTGTRHRLDSVARGDTLFALDSLIATDTLLIETRRTGQGYLLWADTVVVSDTTVGIDTLVRTTASVPLAEGAGVSLYPQPASGSLTVSSEGSRLEAVWLYSLQGRLLETWRVGGHRATLDLGRHPAGMYLLRIQTADAVLARRIVKTEH